MAKRRPALTYPEQLARAMTEAELQENVRSMAQVCGWLHHHHHDSRRSEPGFPDSTMVRPPRVIFAELKKQTGKPEPDQIRWLETLRLCPAVEVYVWRPSDWLDGTIECILR